MAHTLGRTTRGTSTTLRHAPRPRGTSIPISPIPSHHALPRILLHNIPPNSLPNCRNFLPSLPTPKPSGRRAPPAMFRSKPPRSSPSLAPTTLPDPPEIPFSEHERSARRRPPWRRPKSATDPTRSAPLLPSVPSVNDSLSEESFAVPPTSTSSGASSAQLHRPGPLKRISGFFKEGDGRVEENLKSMKRRVVQVRRQPDHAPVRFQMGFRSRTGWEPIRARKENQDCLVALVPWGPASAYNFFAALDGHGRNGHQCAIFVAQRVVAYLNRMLLQDADRQMIANTMHKAIAYAERKLESPNVTTDYQLSGSTGVFVLVHGATLFCANVGDSRAVIGREKDSRAARARRSNGGGLVSELPRRSSKNKNPAIVAHELWSPQYFPVTVSVDQKPSRPDEKERLLAAGARVDAWEAMDVGEERVWLPEARTPGLAVSRSFGDLIVKQYGVDCTPEVYTLDLSEDDRFLVMASDGVFEFLNNEEVVDIVGRWREKGSAQEAAEELVKRATERWIDDDTVIDDISCVIVFMNVISPDVQGPSDPVFMETSVGAADSQSDVESGTNSRNLSRSESLAEGIRDSKQPLPSSSAPEFSSGGQTSAQGQDLEEMMFEDAEEDDGVNENDGADAI